MPQLTPKFDEHCIRGRRRSVRSAAAVAARTTYSPFQRAKIHLSTSALHPCKEWIGRQVVHCFFLWLVWQSRAHGCLRDWEETFGASDASTCYSAYLLLLTFRKQQKLSSILLIESLENSMLFLSNLNKSAVLEFSYDYHNLAHNFLYFYFACWKCHPTLCLLNLAFKNPKWKCLLYGSCDICDLFNITICIDNRIPGTFLTKKCNFEQYIPRVLRYILCAHSLAVHSINQIMYWPCNLSTTVC